MGSRSMSSDNDLDSWADCVEEADQLVTPKGDDDDNETHKFQGEDEGDDDEEKSRAKHFRARMALVRYYI